MAMRVTLVNTPENKFAASRLALAMCLSVPQCHWSISLAVPRGEAVLRGEIVHIRTIAAVWAGATPRVQDGFQFGEHQRSRLPLWPETRIELSYRQASTQYYFRLL
jgi:hypothetical protein